MHLGHAIHQRRVPTIVEQPGLDAGNVLGQPLAVAGRHEHVLRAVQQQDRETVGGTRTPRSPRASAKSYARAYLM